MMSIELSKHQRKQIVKAILIERPVMTTIFDRVDKCRDRAKCEPEPRCILFTGPTGSGKSFTLKEYEARNPPVEAYGSIVQRSVIRVKMPKNRSLKTLARWILRALEVPDWKTFKGDRDALLEYAFEQIDIQGVEVILLDEMQQLTESATDKTLRRAADDFKDLAKDKNVVLVITGLTNAEKLLGMNEQLERLCCYRKTINFFTLNTTESRTEYRNFLKGVDEDLPFDELVKFGQGEFAKKIFKATKGRPSFIMLLIREAAFTAIDNEEQLAEKHFYDAFDDVMTEHFEGLQNPFSND